jgi:hypothetical protein
MKEQTICSFAATEAVQGSQQRHGRGFQGRTDPISGHTSGLAESHVLDALALVLMDTTLSDGTNAERTKAATRQGTMRGEGAGSRPAGFSLPKKGPTAGAEAARL